MGWLWMPDELAEYLRNCWFPWICTHNHFWGLQEMDPKRETIFALLVWEVRGGWTEGNSGSNNHCLEPRNEFGELNGFFKIIIK